MNEILRITLWARAGDRRRSANILVWATWLAADVSETYTQLAREGIDSAIAEAASVGRERKLILTIMSTARDVVPTLRVPVLLDQFEAYRTDAFAGRFGPVPQQSTAASLWAAYMADNGDAVGDALDDAGADYRATICALVGAAAYVTPELRTVAYSERFDAVSRAAALDEANLLAGEGGPW